MQRLTEQILAHAKGLPEGTPVAAKSLLHLGNRAAVDQALSRLAERTQLIRAGRGVYLLPVTSRFGTRAPSVEQAVEALASQRGEIIVPSGAACRQHPRSHDTGADPVGLSDFRPHPEDEPRQTGRRASPRTPLAARNGASAAGEAVRALAWLGPEKAEAALQTLKRKLPPGAFSELVAVAPQLPTWLARSVGKAAHG